VRRRVAREVHLAPHDDDVRLDPVAVQVQADLRVRGDVRELALVGAGVEEDRTVAVPQEPDGDRLWLAGGRHRRQPADDLLAQPASRPLPELGGFVEHEREPILEPWRSWTGSNRG